MERMARFYLVALLLVLIVFSYASASSSAALPRSHIAALHILLLAEEGPPPPPTIHVRDYFPLYGTAYFIEDFWDPDYIRIRFDGGWTPNNIPWDAEMLRIELKDEYDSYEIFSGDWYSYDNSDRLKYWGWWNPGNNHRGIHTQAFVIGADLVVGETLTHSYTRNVYDPSSWIGTQTGTIELTVYDKETVTVPLGTFEAYKVKIRDVRTGTDPGTYETTYWVANGTGIVKLHANWPVVAVNATFLRTPSP